MTGLDYVILAIIGLSALVGLLRGFTKEVLSLITWSGAAGVSYILFPVAQGATLQYISNPMIADGVTALALFVTALVIFSLIANSLSGYVRNSALSGADRGLGFGFGGLRGVILVCAAEIIFSSFTPRDKQSATFLKARFIQPIRQGSDQLTAILPTHFQTYLQQGHGLNKNMREHMKNQLKQNGMPDPSQSPSDTPELQIREDSGSYVTMPKIPGLELGMTTPTPNTPKGQSIPSDSKSMMESLAQLKIRNPEVLDEKAAAETQYNSHELDRLVTVTADEEKVKTMPKVATRTGSNGDEGEDFDLPAVDPSEGELPHPESNE